MRIRTHLILLVCAALLPAFIFVACLTVWFWEQQRTSFEARFLDRVRALSIAIDTEINASVRVLNAIVNAPELALARLHQQPADLEQFSLRAQRLLTSQPSWEGFSLVDASGTQVLALGSPSGAGMAVDGATIRRVIATREPVVSGLVRGAGGRYESQIAVPASRDSELRYILVARIPQKVWLDFLTRFPLAPNATITLTDREGVIIARTLNNDLWVGKPAAPDFHKRIVASREGTLRNKGLEGQMFYSAFSRALFAGWTVGTGVPAPDVEAVLWHSTAALIGGALLAGALAIWLAFFLGRRIAEPISALAFSAEALGRQSPALPPPRGIAEVELVADAFERAGALLRERDHALNTVLEAEQRLRAHAEEANRNKDQFLAMLGHELRNPLGAISNAVAISNVEGVDAVSRSRATKIVERQLGHLRRLVDDLLDVARVTTGKIVLHPRPIELAATLRRCVSVLEDAHRLADHHIEMNLDVVWVMADETRLQQIICNLVENSAKYTPAGGRIQVATRQEAGKAVLTVSDSGGGIAPELLPRIFDLFTQGERTLARSQGGLGLGLTLVHRLVDMHGGSVTAASEGIGKGALFTVRLPLTDGPLAMNEQTAQVAQRAKPKRILIVEDNIDGRETLKLMLNLDGHEVMEADDGPTGVMHAISSLPDVCLVDIGLPGFDGYELARRVRATPTARHLRLIALTGYGQDSDLLRAKEAGFDECLIKPVDIDRLNEIIAAE
jgi:signal transduction histidine kinase/CheY-like chemotaxis protein